MTLRPDWKKVLTKAWSVRFMALAAVLSGLEMALPMFFDSPPLPRGVMTVVVVVVVVAAFFARLVAQKDL